MTREAYASFAFQLFLIAALSYMTLEAYSWPSETKLFPYAVSRLTLLLTIIVFITNAYKAIRAHGAHLREAAGPEEGESALPSVEFSFVARAVREFAWIFGFGAAIGIAGFYPAVFLFLLGYFAVRARMSALRALIWAALSTGCIFLVFYEVLSVRPYLGLFGRWW